MVELGSGLGVVSAALVHMGADVVATDGEYSVVYQLQENLDQNFKILPMESECTEEEIEELPKEVCFPMSTSVTDQEDQLSQFPRKEDIGRYDCVRHWWGSDIKSIENSRLLNNDMNDGIIGSISDEKFHVDVIIAADVVYGDKEDVWDALKNSIESICKIGKVPMTNTDKVCTVDIASGDRCTSKEQKKTILLVAQTARYPELEKKFYQGLEDSGFSQIFRRCISRNKEDVLDCSYESDACTEWEWDNDFDSCGDEGVKMRHQLFGYLCPS